MGGNTVMTSLIFHHQSLSLSAAGCLQHIIHTHTDKWKSNLCPLSQLIIQLWHCESQGVKSLLQFRLREDSSITSVATWLINSPRTHPGTWVMRTNAVDSWWGSGNSTPRRFSPGEWTEETRRKETCFIRVLAHSFVSLELRSLSTQAAIHFTPRCLFYHFSWWLLCRFRLIIQIILG